MSKKPGWVIRQLVAGTKLPCFQLLGTVDGPFQFKRWTAAYAFLIDRATAKGAESITADDPDEDGSRDVFIDYDGLVEQHSIEGRN